MKEIKLKECPCCEGKAEFECRINFVTEQVRAKCSTCKLSTEWVDESVNYYAKEEAAKVWNERCTETSQDDFGGITVDELERALEKSAREFAVRKIMGEEKYRETPKCPICGHRGYNLREIGSDSFNTYVIMTCRNCDTEIRTDKEKIDKFFLERLVQDIEK
jgi:hypothetical protein|nr:MAG TPA: restriction alleviation protein [Caudoviricetes sp.]